MIKYNFVFSFSIRVFSSGVIVILFCLYFHVAVILHLPNMLFIKKLLCCHIRRLIYKMYFIIICGYLLFTAFKPFKHFNFIWYLCVQVGIHITTIYLFNCNASIVMYWIFMIFPGIKLKNNFESLYIFIMIAIVPQLEKSRSHLGIYSVVIYWEYY